MTLEILYTNTDRDRYTKGWKDVLDVYKKGPGVLDYISQYITTVERSDGNK